MKKTINCKGKLLSIEQAQIMGILNLTPDSFYDGGRYLSDKKMLAHTERMIDEGAAIIDIGAYSSRPGATHISNDEEASRLIPAIKSILKEHPNTLISVDTFRAEIAEKAIDVGAAMINDISAGEMDKNMFDTVAKLRVPYFMMHMQGTPQNMQEKPSYENLINNMLDYFSEKVDRLQQLGVPDIIIDPGFGFGKTLAHNYEIVRKLNVFNILGHPILAGVSRKSMVYKPLNIGPEDALNATTALHVLCLQNGASFLRVHDVKEAAEAIKIVTLAGNQP